MVFTGKESDLFKTVFDQARFGMAIVSLEGKWLRVNKEFTKILGYSSEELIFKPIFSYTHPNDIEEDKRQMKQLINLDKLVVNLRKRYIHKSGKVVWVDITANIILNEINEPRFFLVIYHDITEKLETAQNLLKSQQNFEIVVEKTPLPIIISNGISIEYINPELTKKLGYELRDIPTTEIWFKKAYPDEEYRNEVFKIYSEFLKDPNFERSDPMEFYITDKYGNIKNMTINMLELGKDKYLFIFEDLTEKWQQEQEKIRMQKLESLGILAGGIAHDFNNILVGILGNISLIKYNVNINAENESEEFNEILDNLEVSVKRATNLTKQLLTFSKGGKPVKKQEDIIKLIKSAINLVMSGSKSKCNLNIIGDIPKIEIDASQIQQVINNLLINADQAMPNGGNIEITVSILEKIQNSNVPIYDDHKCFVKISIEDQGEGIPLELQSKIFTPYFTTKTTGSGLGLATAYSIIKKHGGWIDFESIPKKSTKFRIYIPIEESKNEEIHVPNDMLLTGKGRILILEDDPIIQEVLRRMLESLDQEFLIVQDGKDMIEEYTKSLAERKYYNVLIIDLTIPGGMGGKETIKKLLDIDPKVNAIVSSGYSNDPILSNYKRYGFKGILTKPYTIIDLKKVLQNFINN